MRHTAVLVLGCVLLALLIACGGGSQTADIPTPEAKVVVEAGIEPTPKNGPAKSVPSTPAQVRSTATPLTRFTLMPMSTPTLSAKSEELNNPDETEAEGLNNPSQETQVLDQQEAGMAKQETVFWNDRPLSLPDCTTDFKFSHQWRAPKMCSRYILALVLT